MRAFPDLSFPSQGYRPDLWYYFITALATTYFAERVADQRAFGMAGTVPHIEVFDPDLGGNNPLNLPYVKVAVYDDWVVVVIQGTTSLYSFIRQALPEGQVANPIGRGLVSGYYLQRAESLYQAFGTYVGTFVNFGKRLIVLGHSYGGAMATLLAPMFARDYPGQVEGVFTMGTTRCGDDEFADNYPATLLNVQNEDDPIPSWPPNCTGLLPRVLRPLPFFPGPHAWKHAGRVFYLRNTGDVWAWDAGVRYDSENLAFAHLEDTTTPSLLLAHTPGLYAENVRVNLPLDGTAVASAYGIKLGNLDAANVAMGAAYGTPFTVRSRL